MDNIELKPNKESFIVKKVFISSLISILTISILLAIFNFTLRTTTNISLQQTIIYSLILLTIINILILINAKVSYKKEKYTILKNKIILKKGTIFTEHETELIIKNITQVWLNLPFLETKLFKTGNIQIKAAGSGDTEIYMSSLDDAKQIYEKISQIMEYNDFTLTKKKLIQKEKPKTIAVFFEIFKNFASFMIGLLAITIFSFAPILQDYPRYNFYATTTIILIVIISLIYFILKFMNLKKRVYFLYEDVIDYEDGFLTENYSFIPIENLADTEITQTFIDKIFQLYDIIISSQGSQNNIAFTNMANGKLFKKNLDNLIRNTPSLIEKQDTNKTITTNITSKKNINKQPEKKQTITEFKMEILRTLISPIIYISILTIIIIIGIIISSFFINEMLLSIPFILLGATILITISFIPLLIKVGFTKYHLNAKSIEETFNFLTTKTKEFTNEKITRVKIHENFIDKLLGTITIEFNSIGSGTNITFMNIKNKPQLIPKILSTLNIQKENIKQEIKSNFSITQFFKANIFLNITLIIITTISLILNVITPAILMLSLYIIAIIQRTIYYKTAKLRFYENYIFYTRGILFRTDTYAKYQNIKDITITKYPASQLGKIKFNIAGEIITQTNKGQNINSINFTAHYIEQIKKIQNETDKTLLGKPLLGIKQNLNHLKNPLTEEILKTKPIKKNDIILLTIISIIIIPLIIILPITLITTYAILNNISYHLKQGRVEKKSGIFYKSKKTILYNRFDHISTSQGLLNKIFKNGDITIYTTGSSMPELTLRNIKNHKKTYEILEKHYE